MLGHTNVSACVCVLWTPALDTGIAVKSDLSVENCSSLICEKLVWRFKIIALSTCFLTKLNHTPISMKFERIKKTLSYVETLTCTEFCCHNLLLLQCFILAGSKCLSLAILCNVLGLWNIILKGSGTLQSLKSLQED